MSKEKSTSAPAPGTKPEPHDSMFGMTNFILFGVGILLILLGFVLMSGGASKDPAVFNKEVFNSTRITVAPLMVLLGFGVNIAAIMFRQKK